MLLDTIHLFHVCAHDLEINMPSQIQPVQQVSSTETKVQQVSNTQNEVQISNADTTMEIIPGAYIQ